MMRSEVLNALIASLLLFGSLLGSTAQHAWERPGCHLVGYTKEVRVPGCHMEEVPMNACRGFCLSYSYPSSLARLLESEGSQILTTTGNCCSIQETHDVNVWLRCENNEERLVTYRSAAACECSLCEV
ncbi:thyrostimulin alpha-2 subunit-like [Amphiura filiformis]|uniref:thyrostimulin alpha-2 subunit-like n=1 Tax=Amphiura filiformis TaxID=82378 RepID=UPI003B228A1F